LILETARLKLRLLNNSDAEMILELLNEESFIKNIGDKAVHNHQDALNYINNSPLAMQQKLGFSLYCCVKKDDEQAIGISGLIKREGIDYPEIGFAFLTKHCRQGYGFESTKAVISYVKNQLALKQLQAICNLDNEASKALLQRLGFCFNKNISLAENNQAVMLFDLIAM
jgi:RimJ/RimL family protein N-acetyltransferase